MANKAKLFLAGVASLGLGLLSAGAASACVLSVQPADTQWMIRYDPFSQDATQRQFEVAVVNQGQERCSGKVRVELNGEEFGLRSATETARVPYALIDDRNGADVTPRAGGVSARRLNSQPVALAPGERGRLQFTFAAAPPEVPSQGAYTQEATILLEDDNGLPVGARQVTLTFVVVPAAVMGLKGQFQRSNGVARIDLGELTAGTRPLTASLFVLSTGGYRVTVKSTNEGKLRLGKTDWYVDYTLGVGSKRMGLDEPATINVVSRRARADDYPLSVEVGSVAGLRAGDYTDELMFTVAAL
ncbi:MAG: hypothetical protein V4466_05600 [Pseudomonadota bacterium]